MEFGRKRRAVTAGNFNTLIQEDNADEELITHPFNIKDYLGQLYHFSDFDGKEKMLPDYKCMACVSRYLRLTTRLSVCLQNHDSSNECLVFLIKVPHMSDKT